jgi:site-specific DNA-methyltransferase (adenine-specific)
LFELHNGDCLEIMPDIPDGSVDMSLCDLPYGVTARNPWDQIIPFGDMWAQYKRVLKYNGVAVLTAIQPFSSSLALSNLE